MFNMCPHKHNKTRKLGLRLRSKMSGRLNQGKGGGLVLSTTDNNEANNDKDNVTKIGRLV